MKKNFLFGAFALTIIATATLVCTNSANTMATNTLLANVEALAQMEDGDGVPYPCQTLISSSTDYGWCGNNYGGGHEGPISSYTTYDCDSSSGTGSCQKGWGFYSFGCNNSGGPYSDGYTTSVTCGY